jgi:hypothetical protein
MRSAGEAKDELPGDPVAAPTPPRFTASELEHAFRASQLASNGPAAIKQQRETEAHQRNCDRHFLFYAWPWPPEISEDELQDEIDRPNRLTDDPTYWRTCRRGVDAHHETQR